MKLIDKNIIALLALSLLIGIDVVAQRRLDILSDFDNERIEHLDSMLLVRNRQCGIIVSPSFSNSYGISVSKNSDSLILIEKLAPNVTLISGSADIPVRKIKIDSEFGRSITSLVNIAVSSAMPNYRWGHDGTTYYFLTTDGRIAKTWSPQKSNSVTMVKVIKALKKGIETNNPQSLVENEWCTIDKLAVSFKNASEMPPFCLETKTGEIDGVPYIEYRGMSPKFAGINQNSADLRFYATLRYPAEYITDTFGIKTPVNEDYQTELIFTEFCKNLDIWEKAAAKCVNAQIVIADDIEEKYETECNDKTVNLYFSMPRKCFDANNLRERMRSAFVIHMLENAMPNDAVRPAPKQ